jgi:mannose-6-phosphate isomerase-like protein (cupin superfamily)
MASNAWGTMRLVDGPTVTAPDGSEVRVLLATGRGSFIGFSLAGGQTSIAVVHRTVEEIWFFLGGRGELWRAAGDGDPGEVVEVGAGVCLTIPVGARFQFRAHGGEPLRALAATMPPWPGEDEAVVVDGPWAPTVPAARPRSRARPPAQTD